MATATLSKFATSFRFTVNTANLNSGWVNSPEIELSNLKWKVKLCKKSTDGYKNTEAIAVHLVCVFGSDSTNVSCEAQAAIKLLQKDAQADKSVVKYLSKETFDNENASHGIDDFIKWDDFLRQHVHEDQATFDIEISTSPLKRKRKECNDMNEVSTKFHVAIEGVSNLGTCLSPAVVLQGVRWKVICKKMSDFLTIHLYGDKNDMDANWSYKVDAIFTLASFNSDVEPISYNLIREYGEVASWGFTDFFKWSEFVDGNANYVLKDKANLFVEMKVEQPKPKWKIQRHTLSNDNSSLGCCVCLDSFSSGKIFSTKCGHLFCKPCFDKSIAVREVCPTCQAATSSAQLHPIYFA